MFNVVASSFWISDRCCKQYPINTTEVKGRWRYCSGGIVKFVIQCPTYFPSTVNHLPRHHPVCHQCYLGMTIKMSGSKNCRSLRLWGRVRAWKLRSSIEVGLHFFPKLFVDEGLFQPRIAQVAIPQNILTHNDATQNNAHPPGVHNVIPSETGS